MNRRPLPAGFYARDTVQVARELLGCVLVTTVRGTRTAGRIVEVEAYVGPHDPADHGYEGKQTARNAALFGPPGTSYVYFIYGSHWCFNAVTERSGYPSAVLIRAVEPLAGLPVMQRRRGSGDLRRLCAGPGRLCRALGIDGQLNGRRLDRRPLTILEGGVPSDTIAASPRIGVSRAADWPLRFYVRESPWLSRAGEGISGAS